MNEKPQIVCLGEALVDFIPDRHAPLESVESFTRKVGGAPANVSLALARSGVKAGLITRVGDDSFGRFIATALAQSKVRTTGIVFDKERRTGITFLEVQESGDWSFLPYRQYAAEKGFEANDVDTSLIADADFIHLCSNPMVFESGMAFTKAAVEAAQRSNTLVSFDANMRTHLWPAAEACAAACNELLPAVDIAKVNESEAVLLTGLSDPLQAAHELHRRGAGLAVVTLGDAGCVYSGSMGEGECAAPLVEVVDSTGAGDNFCAGMLKALLPARGLPVAAWPQSIVQEAMEAGCQAGANAVTFWGATQ